MRWIAALLSFIFLAGAALFGLFGNENGTYSPDSYPEVYTLMKGSGLEVRYTPALAVVSPSRTDYLNITLWVRNTENTPKIVTLRFREPASLVSTTADVLSDYREANGDVTFRAVSFVLPEKAEKVFKIQLKNVYRVLETDKEEYTVGVSTDAEEVKVPVMLYSQSVPYTSIWPYHAALQDDPKRITLLLDPADIRHFRGDVFHLRAYRSTSSSFSTSQTAEVRLVQRFTGTLRFTYRAVSNGTAASVDYFRVYAYTADGVRTLVDVNNLKNSDTGWVEFNAHVRGLEKLVFEAKLTAGSYKTAEVWVRDLHIGDGYDIAYYTVKDIPNSGSGWHNAVFEFNVPPAQYSSIVIVPQWNNGGRKDWVRIYVYDGSDWQKKWEKDMGDFCGGLRAWLRQPVWIDTSNIEQVNQVKVVWRHKSNPHLYAKVYMVPYDFPNTVFFEEVCDQNTTHTLQLQTDGQFGILTFPQNSCTVLKEKTVDSVWVRATYESQQVEANWPIFYDPDKSDDLLWRMYEQWKSGLEVNGQ